MDIPPQKESEGSFIKEAKSWMFSLTDLSKGKTETSPAFSRLQKQKYSDEHIIKSLLNKYPFLLIPAFKCCSFKSSRCYKFLEIIQPCEKYNGTKSEHALVFSVQLVKRLKPLQICYPLYMTPR